MEPIGEPTMFLDPRGRSGARATVPLPQLSPFPPPLPPSIEAGPVGDGEHGAQRDNELSNERERRLLPALNRRTVLMEEAVIQTKDLQQKVDAMVDATSNATSASRYFRGAKEKSYSFRRRKAGPRDNQLGNSSDSSDGEDAAAHRIGGDAKQHRKLLRGDSAGVSPGSHKAQKAQVDRIANELRLDPGGEFRQGLSGEQFLQRHSDEELVRQEIKQKLLKLQLLKREVLANDDQESGNPIPQAMTEPPSPSPLTIMGAGGCHTALDMMLMEEASITSEMSMKSLGRGPPISHDQLMGDEIKLATLMGESVVHIVKSISSQIRKFSESWAGDVTEMVHFYSHLPQPSPPPFTSTSLLLFASQLAEDAAELTDCADEVLYIAAGNSLQKDGALDGVLARTKYHTHRSKVWLRGMLEHLRIFEKCETEMRSGITFEVDRAREQLAEAKEQWAATCRLINAKEDHIAGIQSRLLGHLQSISDEMWLKSCASEAANPNHDLAVCNSPAIGPRSEAHASASRGESPPLGDTEVSMGFESGKGGEKAVPLWDGSLGSSGSSPQQPQQLPPPVTSPSAPLGGHGSMAVFVQSSTPIPDSPPQHLSANDISLASASLGGWSGKSIHILKTDPVRWLVTPRQSEAGALSTRSRRLAGSSLAVASNRQTWGRGGPLCLLGPAEEDVVHGAMTTRPFPTNASSLRLGGGGSERESRAGETRPPLPQDRPTPAVNHSALPPTLLGSQPSTWDERGAEEQLQLQYASASLRMARLWANPFHEKLELSRMRSHPFSSRTSVTQTGACATVAESASLGRSARISDRWTGSRSTSAPRLADSETAADTPSVAEGETVNMIEVPEKTPQMIVADLLRELQGMLDTTEAPPVANYTVRMKGTWLRLRPLIVALASKAQDRRENPPTITSGPGRNIGSAYRTTSSSRSSSDLIAAVSSTVHASFPSTPENDPTTSRRCDSAAVPSPQAATLKGCVSLSHRLDSGPMTVSASAASLLKFYDSLYYNVALEEGDSEDGDSSEWNSATTTSERASRSLELVV